MNSDRYTATVACAYCAWRARITGDKATECGEFLRARLLAHCTKSHPTYFPPLADIISRFTITERA